MVGGRDRRGGQRGSRASRARNVRIEAPASKVALAVVATDEELMMARHAWGLLRPSAACNCYWRTNRLAPPARSNLLAFPERLTRAQVG
jgi:hypothetical protein